MPELHQLVKQHMLHGPCGNDNSESVSMVDGACGKKFPEPFQAATRVEQNGYPAYRRRDDGRCVEKLVHGRTIPINNRYVVPYNPFLLKHFKAHINVELCSSIKSVKYLHKYAYKGHDTASIRITSDHSTANYDEITTYQSTRFVSPSEAAFMETPTGSPNLTFTYHRANRSTSRKVLRKLHLPAPS